jgi:hypothetical protein
MDMNRILGYVVSELVRFSIDQTRLHSAPGHPDAEAARMMVPTVA